MQFPVDRDDDIVGAMLLGLGLMTALTTIYLALRPPEPRPQLTDDDEARMRELLRRHGAARLARLLRAAPRQERDVVRDGKSCIAYRVVSG